MERTDRVKKIEKAATVSLIIACVVWTVLPDMTEYTALWLLNEFLTRGPTILLIGACLFGIVAITNNKSGFFDDPPAP